MDAAELHHRAAWHSDCVPPDLVDRLLALGHSEVVRGLAVAEDGEWFCARAWARLLVDRGELDEALEVLSPYVDTGWWPAVEETARLLDAGGRGEEAIALVRPFARDEGRVALRDLGLLLARHGQGEEAYELLVPHLCDWLVAEALVEVGVRLGRGDEVAELLEARLAPGNTCSRCESPECPGASVEPFNAVALLASVRERQGRTDEAVAVLRAYDFTVIDNRDPLAELLLRHDRLDELRAYVAGESPWEAARQLAEALEARGDVAGAVDVYRGHGEEDRWHTSYLLAKLLARHGRGAEGIDVLRALGSAEDWIVDALCELFAAEGRAEEGLTHLDVLKARRGQEEWELFRLRGPLMAACGRLDEALAETTAHPESGGPYEREWLAHLLTEAGRPEEAVDLLTPERLDHRRLLGSLLVDLGRVEEAVTLLRTPSPRIPPPQPVGYSDCPPF